MPAEYVVSLLPDTKTFGQMHEYINDDLLMSDLQWMNPSAKWKPQPQVNNQS